MREASTADEPRVRLVRHPLRVRRLRVASIVPITPRLTRLTLEGRDLEGFTTMAPDDHVKVLFPPASGETPGFPEIVDGRLAWPSAGPRPVARDYTPVRFDPRAGELDLEIVRHEGGHASAWLDRAKRGDILGGAGPRGSHVLEGPLAGLLLVGDETALPAIARWLRELPPHVHACALLEVQDEGERRALPTAATADVRWVYRGDAAPGTTTRLEEAVHACTLPRPLTHAWVAGEARVVQRVRAHLKDARGVPADRMSARGYWKLGIADHQEPHDD